MFAAVILGWHRSDRRHRASAGVAAAILADPTGFFVFRLHGAYFAIGTWVIAEVVRLLLAQWKALGGGTGTSLPRDGTPRHARRRGVIAALFGVLAPAGGGHR